MSEWKSPNKNPSIPPGIQKILDSLNQVKTLVEGQIEADLIKIDQLNQELRRIKKSEEMRKNGKS